MRPRLQRIQAAGGSLRRLAAGAGRLAWGPGRLSRGPGWLAWGAGRLAGGVCDLVFSPRCAGCDAELPDGSAIPFCPDCRAVLSGARGLRCGLCGGELARPLTEPRQCPECRGRRGPVERVWTLGSYDDYLRKLVLRMKQVQEEPLSAALAEMLWHSLGPEIREWQPDVVLAIPMHWSRRLVRGTNSPQVMAGVLSRKLKVPHAAHALYRRRRTQRQGRLSPTARAENVRHAFAVRPEVRFERARALVVDDILTTGATSREAAGVLKRAGVSAAALVVAARAGAAAAR